MREVNSHMASFHIFLLHYYFSVTFMVTVLVSPFFRATVAVPAFLPLILPALFTVEAGSFFCFEGIFSFVLTVGYGASVPLQRHYPVRMLWIDPFLLTNDSLNTTVPLAAFLQ